MTRRIIATGSYRNGGCGNNHVSLTRGADGYVVRDHHADGFWYANVRQAKAAFRNLITRTGAAITYRQWAA